MIFSAYQDTNNGIAGVSVVSSGHIFAQKGRKIDRPNGAIFHHIMFIEDGEGVFETAQKRYILSKGTVIFFKKRLAMLIKHR